MGQPLKSPKHKKNQNHEIQTPLLKLLIFFFGHLGIQLHPFKENWPSALLNLICATAILIGLCRMDPYNVEAGSQWLEENFKPLVGMLIKVDAVTVHPTTYLCQVAYLTMHGPTIVRLLDHHLFSTVYRSIGHEKVIVLTILTAFTTGFVALHFEHIIMIPEDCTLFQGLLWKITSVLCLFVMHQLQCMVLGLLHYGKYATVRAMDGLLQRLDTTTTIELVKYEQIFAQVRTIAELNHQLHRLISFPLMLFWTRAVVDSVAFICLFQALHRDYGIFLYFYSCSYSVYIAYLDETIQRRLLQIVCRLQSHYHAEKIFKCSYIRHLQQMLLQSEHDDNDEEFGTFSEEVAFRYDSPDHVQIRALQLKVYQEHFRLKLFHLCHVNYRFILGAFLFIFQYSVLVIQTGNK